VLTAENGAQGVDLFDRSSDEISMVLLDVVMPAMDGPETAVAIQSRNPDVPILVMSGLGDHDALHRFGKVRIAGFVPKPFAPDQLAQAVAVARHGAARWAGKDRRETGEPVYAGPERLTVGSSGQ
jgi:two-component system cell cycle sensor histidine kinase/response regulator CckA